MFKENMFKIVTIGNPIGKHEGFSDNDLWEVNQSMLCTDGLHYYMAPGINLQRIDDNSTEVSHDVLIHKAI